MKRSTTYLFRWLNWGNRYKLRQSLQRANDSATGLDQVHYQLLTHLPNSALSVLLKVYNHVWESGCFPPSWREAVVIPISKPGKDHSDPGNFRPKALTSCLCKTMERMIKCPPHVVPPVAGSSFREAVRLQEKPQCVASSRSFWNVYDKCLR